MVLLTQEETEAEKVWTAVTSRVSVEHFENIIKKLGYRAELICTLQIYKVVFNKRSPQRDSLSSLHLAAKHGNVEFLKIMLNVGNVRPDHKTNILSWTPLHYAIFSGHVHAARILLKENALIDVKDNEEQTPLLLALSRGHRRAAAFLIQRGANINSKDKYGRGVLHIILDETVQQHVDWSIKVSLNILEFLILKGSNIEDCDLNEDSVLHYCVRRKKADVVDLVNFLIKTNRKIINAKNARGYLPIHECKSPKVVKILMKNGADINSLTPEGRTILHLNVENLEFVTFLIENGIDADITDIQGRLAFHTACTYSNISVDILKILHQTTLNATRADDCGNDAILIACENGVNLKAFQFLLEVFGVGSTNKKKQSPLTLALLARSYDIASALLTNGADIDAVDNMGISPRQIDPKFFKKTSSQSSAPSSISSPSLKDSLSIKDTDRIETPLVDLTADEVDEEIERELMKMESEIQENDEEIVKEINQINEKKDTPDITNKISKPEQEEIKPQTLQTDQTTPITLKNTADITNQISKTQEDKIKPQTIIQTDPTTPISPINKPLPKKPTTPKAKEIVVKQETPKLETVEKPQQVAKKLNSMKEDVEEMKEKLEELKEEGERIEDELRSKLEKRLKSEVTSMKKDVDVIADELNFLANRTSKPPQYNRGKIGNKLETKLKEKK